MRVRPLSAPGASEPTPGPSERGSARRFLALLGVLSLLLCGGWAAAGLAFRFAVYESLPIEPDQPYGIADLIEGFHYVALVGLAALAALLGGFLLAFGRFRLRGLAAALVALGVALPFAYWPLHAWVASLAGR